MSTSPLGPRAAGLLLHPTSLPGPRATGDFSHSAYRFIEFAAAAGFRVWQVLPLSPTHPDGSPYNAVSMFAGNPALISRDWLVDRGWLRIDEAAAETGNGEDVLALAARRFEETATAEQQAGLRRFTRRESAWLADYALYQSLRHDRELEPWWQWPAGLRDRDPAALEKARHRLDAPIRARVFTQYVFDSQWSELRGYAGRHGIRVFGDMPLYVSPDSADVWSRQDLFKLKRGRARTVTGVPPDYFSDIGQIWGQPTFDWPAHAAGGKHGYDWWVQRFRRLRELYDIVRIDHFRGLAAGYEIPAGAETALDGQWVPAPGEAILRQVFRRLGRFPIVAEDLGTITPDVIALRDQFRLPGMRVYQFGFDGDPANPHLPHTYPTNAVAYTGTHDNPTTVGWWETLDDVARDAVLRYLGPRTESVPGAVLRSVLASTANLAVTPLQDLLELPDSARMNRPGTATGNWGWRFDWDQLPPAVGERAYGLNRTYGRV